MTQRDRARTKRTRLRQQQRLRWTLQLGLMAAGLLIVALYYQLSWKPLASEPVRRTPRQVAYQIEYNHVERAWQVKPDATENPEED